MDSGEGVIATITDTIATRHRLPVYVAEGTTAQKMKKINSIAYLRHCYEALQDCAATIFIYGHSADENDAHIYRAIFSSQAKHVYFGIYKPDETNSKVFDGLLAKYQKTAGTDKEYSFYDSESAGVWS